MIKAPNLTEKYKKRRENENTTKKLQLHNDYGPN